MAVCMCVISFNGRKGDEEGERCMNAAAARVGWGVGSFSYHSTGSDVYEEEH